MNALPDKRKLTPDLLALALLCGGGYWISRYSYPLFHSLVEALAVVVTWGVFAVAWITRGYHANSFYLVMGTANLCVGAMTLLHMLAFKGVSLFPGYGSNLPTQLWIAGRYLLAISLLVAPHFLKRKIPAGAILGVYTVIAAGLIVAIFHRQFPDCFVENAGLTPFKIISEYVISGLLLAAFGTLMKSRRSLDARVFFLLSGALFLAIATEFAFTLYHDPYGIWNWIGHILGVVSSVLFYKALVEASIVRPHDTLFRGMTEARSREQLAEEELRKAHDELEQKVRVRTAELSLLNAELHKREASLRALSTNIPNGIIYQLVYTEGGSLRFDYISEATERYFGFPASRALADAQAVFGLLHPEDVQRVQGAAEASARTLTDLDVEARILGPCGEIRWIHLRSKPRRLENGDTLSDGIAFDITARKLTEEALRRANRALLVHKECDETLARATDEHELLRQICDIVVTIAGARMAWVGFPEEDEAKTVRPVASAGDDHGYLGNIKVSWAEGFYGQGSVGRAIRTGEMVVIQELSSDPRMEPWREKQLEVGYITAVTLPLVWQKKSIGALSIYFGKIEVLNDDELALLKQLAVDLTYGIVALRTRAEHAQLQKELLDISEREKQLISQELHDGLCQNLAGAAMMASSLQKRFPDPGDPHAEAARQLCKALNENINETRNLAHGLHPVGPEGEGLMNALGQLAESVTKLFHIHCIFKCPEPVMLHHEAASTHLFRIAQEAINNARRHGESDSIMITLQNCAGGITLSIRDNGVGLPEDLGVQPGLGLRSMRYRATEIGADLCVARREAGGTEVRCFLPQAG